MAEIATYKCSENTCAYVVRLSFGINGRIERLCHSCRTINTQLSSNCIHCGSENIHQEQLGLKCPRCANGTLGMPRLTVLS